MNYSNSVTPVLSIIIPTRNRQDYAISTINSILGISSDLFELVIQDNSDGDDLENYIKSNIFDTRIRYNHTRTKLDFIANFNKALEISTGEYITFIGDDDGITHEVISATMWAKENGIDAITPSRVTDYLWPDFSQKYYGAIHSGSLKIKRFTGKIEFKDAEKGLIACARSAFQNIVDYCGVPKIYYGIVKRDCMECVYKKTGTYFPGVSPDMAGAIAVSSYVKRMCAIDYPLFLPGSSAKSGAGISAQKKHHGRLQDQPHLPDGCWNDWPDVVPPFYAVQTVWAQSGWAALKAIGREDILSEYNAPLLHAMCAVFNPQYAILAVKNYFKALKYLRKSYFIGILTFCYYYIYTWWTRVKSMTGRLFNMFRPQKVINVTGLENIEEAVNALNQYLDAGGKRFLFYAQNLSK